MYGVSRKKVLGYNTAIAHRWRGTEMRRHYQEFASATYASPKAVGANWEVLDFGLPDQITRGSGPDERDGSVICITDLDIRLRLVNNGVNAANAGAQGQHVRIVVVYFDTPEAPTGRDPSEVFTNDRIETFYNPNSIHSMHILADKTYYLQNDATNSSGDCVHPKYLYERINIRRKMFVKFTDADTTGSRPNIRQGNIMVFACGQRTVSTGNQIVLSGEYKIEFKE